MRSLILPVPSYEAEGAKEDGEEKEKWRERRRSDLTEVDRHVACAL